MIKKTIGYRNLLPKIGFSTAYCNSDRDGEFKVQLRKTRG